MQESQIKQGIYNLFQALYYYCARTNQRLSDIHSYFCDPSSKTSDVYRFQTMILKTIPGTQPQIINYTYNFIIQKYNITAITGQVLDQIMLNIQSQQANASTQQVQQQQRQQEIPVQQNVLIRDPNTLLNLFKNNLQKVNIDLQQLFIKFDSNKDNQQTQNEFTEMFTKVVKDINAREIANLIQYIFESRQLVTLFQFQKLFRAPEVSLLESNIYENPQNKDLLKSNFVFEEYVVTDLEVPAMKEFIQKFQQLKQNNELYQDPTFPPNKKSLGKLDYQWMRVREFINNPQFFVKEDSTNRFGLGKWIGPEDLQQGALGDCYFLASLSALGNRRPDLLLDIFVTRQVNKHGIYCVKLCIDGGWKAIAIDDYFPTIYQQPAFTKGKQNELWVMVIEKAWAKVFGSYSNIEAGFPREVLRTLTGAPTKTLFTSEQDFTQELEQVVKQRCIMVAATISDQNIKGMGLQASHAYSVLKIKSANNTRLIKLRNPWGKDEWKGAWSDNSTKWTPQLKSEFKITNRNDGIFYMDIDDFKRYFHDVQVCYVKDKYQYSFIYDKIQKRKSKHYALEIKNTGHYYITVSQKNQRFESSYDYSLVKLFIDGQGIQNQAGEVWIEVQLTKGIHYLYVKMYWESPLEVINISTYGQEKVNIKGIQKQPDLIRNQLYVQACNNKELKPYEKHPDIKKVSDFNIKTGYYNIYHSFGYYYLINNSNKTFSSDVQFLKFSGLKLMKPYSGTSLKIEVLPGKDFFAPLVVSSKGYSFQMTESYILK